jgi:hypothetical protein
MYEVLLNMLKFYSEVLLNMLEFYFEVLLNMLEHVKYLFWSIAKHVAIFLTLIRVAMVNKKSELAKRQTRDRYGRFVSTSSHTAPPRSH